MPPDPSLRRNSRHSADSQFDDLSDEDIMRAVQQGDGDAFAVLFDRFHRLVLITALKIVRDVSEAEEATQNVFFEIYRIAEKFDSAKGSLKVWLLQYAYHRSMNRRNYLLLRQFYSRQELGEVLGCEESTQGPPQLFSQEIVRVVKEALGTLNDAQRRTIEMVFFEGLTLSDVSEKTSESLSNIRNHYYRGLERLRNCLTEEPAAIRRREAVSVGEVNHVKA